MWLQQCKIRITCSLGMMHGGGARVHSPLVRLRCCAAAWSAMTRSHRCASYIEVANCAIPRCPCCCPIGQGLWPPAAAQGSFGLIMRHLAGLQVAGIDPQ